MDKEKEIYNYCESRWDYYKLQDGGYYPSKHDNLVFKEASTHFMVSVEKVEQAFNKVSREKSDELIKKLSQNEIKKLLNQITIENKELPLN